jgi:hypothetical protein
MKSIITMALLLSAIFSYGQKVKTIPFPKSSSYADNLTALDSLRLWIDKIDHMYTWQCEQRDIIWKLSQAVDILEARIEVLEKRPYLSIDTTMRITDTATYSTTGHLALALDSIEKILFKTKRKP